MKITIDTNEIGGKIKQGIKKYGKYAGAGAATKTASLLGKKMKEKADRKAIENKAKSPFEPLVRQQKVEAGLKKLRSLKK